MKNFEQDLNRLEELTQTIKRNDITLEEALASFEEGIKLAKTLEKDLDKIESKVQILMNSDDLEEEITEEPKVKKTSKAKSSSKASTGPTLDLFDINTEVNGTRNA